MYAVVAGASEGLGEAFAHALAARGYDLVLIARREAMLEAVAARIRDAHGTTRDVRIVVQDLAGPDVAEVLAGLARELPIAMGVYNAAYAPIGGFLDQSLDALLTVVDVNVRGPVVFARTLAPAMVERGSGGLVIMGSLAGFQGAPRIATYAATKAFGLVLAEGLWHELRPHGVDVLVSAAGAIRTPGYDRARDAEAPGTLDAATVAEQTLDALGTGPSIVPGTVNRLARFVMGRLLPRRSAVAVMARNTQDLE
jgi:short-subunit dehydrogenase